MTGMAQSTKHLNLRIRKKANKEGLVLEKNKEEKHETCEVCGMEFVLPEDPRQHIFALDENGKKIFFHKPSCKYKWLKNHGTCTYCGKSLKGNPNYNPSRLYTSFCSDECREKEKMRIGREKGIVKKCKYCGKEFIRKDGVFCNYECYEKARLEGWNPKNTAKASQSKKIKMDDYVDVREVCAICKKQVMTKKKVSEIDHRTVYLCSNECKEEYLKRTEKMVKLKKLETEKAKARNKR